MGFFADAIKFMRSRVFKSEFENGNFTTRRAVNDSSGNNISNNFTNVKKYINNLIDINGTQTIRVSGQGIPSPTSTSDGYRCNFTITLTDVGQGVKNLRVVEYSIFKDAPALTLSGNVVTVSGFSNFSALACSATVAYERKMNYIT